LIESGKFSGHDIIDLKINESNSKKSLDTQLKTSHSSIKQRRFRLIDLLNSFSLQELERFIEFTNSEYHNKDKKTTVLLNFLVKNVIHTSDFNEPLRNKASSMIFQIKNQSTNKLNNHPKKLLSRTMSLLTKLAEEFLYIDMLKYNRSDRIKTELLLKQLREKNQTLYFYKTIKRQQKKLNNIAIRSTEYYNECYNLELNKLYFNDLQYKEESTIHLLNYNIDIIYIINKFKLFLYQLHEYEFYMKKNLSILEDISSLIEKPEYSTNPIINVYATTALLLKTNDVSYYSKLIDLLHKSVKHLPKDDLTVLYLLVINFCKKKISEDNNSYYEEIFELYKTMNDNNLLVNENNFINLGLLTDIIKVSSITGKYSWAYEVNERYISFVDHKSRDSFYNFNLGIIEYGQDNFKKALSHFINRC